MKKIYQCTLWVCAFLLLGAADLSAQQKKDTTRVKEEVILSSQMMNDGQVELVEYELKPIFKYISPWERTSLFKVGYRPSLRSIPGDSRVEAPGHILSARYERKLPNPSFSVAVESSLRLYKIGDKGYDYRTEDATRGGQTGLFGRTWNSGQYFTHNFSTDLSFRFYLFQKKRIKVKASGNNFSQSFFQVKIKDVLTYGRRRTFNIESSADIYIGGEVISIIDRKMWHLRPAYFMLGWGTQRQVSDKLWLELQLGAGPTIPGSEGLLFYDKDMVYEVNLFFGFAFGKRKSLKE